MKSWCFWFILGYSLFNVVQLTLCENAYKQNDKDTKKIKGEQTWQHIEQILELNHTLEGAQTTRSVQERLIKIYHDSIKPLDEAYRFSDLNKDSISEGEIFANPMILFLGPWSTGKSTIINYLLGIENSTQQLFTGAEPTTSDFTVILNGTTHQVVKGMQLVSDKSKHYSPLHKFGLNFLERFQGIEIPSKLLQRVTLVDTPGIIENKKQQERGYPFNDVCKWFIDRAQLIFLVFDPSKLDIGSELEALFKQLKGHEGKVRIVLNKADTVSTQELMRVYGALFWTLAPLVHEVEPPRVYIVSLWSKPYRADTMGSLFYQEECSLLEDIHQIIKNQMGSKIAATRRHAFLVRLHALTVDTYIKAFEKNKNLIWGDNDEIWRNIILDPIKYDIRTHLLRYQDVSVHDLPTRQEYDYFFSINSRDSFQALSHFCPFIGECAIDKLVEAIDIQLPNLLGDLRSGNMNGYCSVGSQGC